MKKPSIDRKDNDGNYEYSNCRFIELSENVAERNRRVSSKITLQYDLKNNFIKEWYSSNEAGNQLNINTSSICECCNKHRKSAGGFIWKYKE